MYIVTRTFRDANGVFGVGDIVSPTSVKTFRSRLQQRHIVDVDEANVAEWAEFFKNRYGIDLSDKLSEYLETQPEVEVPVDLQAAPTEEPETEEPQVEEAEESEVKQEDSDSW